MSLNDNNEPDDQPEQRPASNVPENEESPSENLAEEDRMAPINEPVTEEPTAIIASTQTETMDVHHHGHIHHEKKWKDYLFQFLMLFLAVFCGFLAEYQLEHTIENQREKQFLKSMVEDLEKDLVLLENESKAIPLQHARLDSMVNIIYGGSFDQAKVNALYEIQRKYLYPISLRLISRTEMQLKNAGACGLSETGR